METLSAITIQVVNIAVNTVGYMEAANKESFITGVQVAVSKADEIYRKEIEVLSKQLVILQSDYDLLKDDMTTLTSIITRYSNQD